MRSQQYSRQSGQQLAEMALIAGVLGLVGFLALQGTFQAVSTKAGTEISKYSPQETTGAVGRIKHPDGTYTDLAPASEVEDTPSEQ